MKFLLSQCLLEGWFSYSVWNNCTITTYLNCIIDGMLNNISYTKPRKSKFWQIFKNKQRKAQRKQGTELTDYKIKIWVKDVQQPNTFFSGLLWLRVGSPQFLWKGMHKTTSEQGIQDSRARNNIQINQEGKQRRTQLFSHGFYRREA